MKTIGFIDLFIDEWHANNYPDMIRRSKWKDEVELTLAWEEAPRGGKCLRDWCEQFNVAPAESIEQVTAECDGIVVLAPSNPEMHERLAEIPLRSGKRVYVDKPFAPDVASARRMFENADQHATALMSCSALRYGPTLQETLSGSLKDRKATFAQTHGGGRSFEEYSIHQVEMLVMLLGTGARRVMQCGTEATNHMIVEYEDQRRGCMTLNPHSKFTWEAHLGEEERIECLDCGNFFQAFIDAMLEFLLTGKSTVDPAETVEIAALVQTGVEALQSPGTWVNVKKA
ncbi:MAG: Gfo/Idh/MocA family oxidoreductase [Phycisphaerae bacterium]|nr:Gfo/Idh/MocA family oxidoreductase [Phycisphaerae bacterium]